MPPTKTRLTPGSLSLSLCLSVCVSLCAATVFLLQAPARHHDGDFLFVQKLESVKAAFLCGGVGAASRLLAVGAGAVLPPILRDALASPEPAASGVLFGVAAGFAQGALFGLTYR